ASFSTTAPAAAQDADADAPARPADSASALAQRYADVEPGQFIGQVFVEWVDGGEDRDMRLILPFGYKDRAGRIWMVPKGAIINGASIPRSLWSLVGSPYVGRYRRAAVIHDFFWADRDDEDQVNVDRLFREMVRVAGISTVRAQAMYVTVRCCGRTFRIFPAVFSARTPTSAPTGDPVTPSRRPASKPSGPSGSSRTRGISPGLAQPVKVKPRVQKRFERTFTPAEQRKLIAWVQQTSPNDAQIEAYIRKIYERRMTLKERRGEGNSTAPDR
ncbi:MAG: DUF1353 domain-containing protein, partial [Pseudomonadota bacterium]